MTHAPARSLPILWTLLRVARQRARARMRAQAKRSRGASPQVIFAFAMFGALMFQGVLAMAYLSIAQVAGEVAREHGDKLSISPWLFKRMVGDERWRQEEPARRDTWLQRERDAASEPSTRRKARAAIERSQERETGATTALTHLFDAEARLLVQKRGGSEAQWRDTLQDTYARDGSAGFVATNSGWRFDAPALRVMTALLIVWWLSLALQGESVSLDVARRRHPMWEWYRSFPVSPVIVFVAEGLAPLVGNPFLLLSPLLLAVLAGLRNASLIAALCALPLGIPLAIAAAIWNKTLEVLIMLRSSTRNRAGWFALSGGIGFLALFAPVLIMGSPAIERRLIGASAGWVAWLPSADILLGVDSAGGWLRAFAASVTIALALGVPAVALLRFATARGLESGFGRDDGTVRAAASAAVAPRGWLADPLVRKEWLWLRRDRGALIQMVAVPLLLVSLQFANFQNMLRHVELTWNKLAALIVGLGAYMLFIAGPRALLSEGPALMLTLSWPRSLEDTLRMKVRLLFIVVSAMVIASLVAVAWMFPADMWRVALVAAAWFVFGSSVAEKAVTLIQAPSQSGESEPVPQSRAWVAGIGNLTFAIGLFTAQWQLAIAGVALNWVFAGALWQGFRNRLPYLFDPDSEPQLRPPTILSSVVAIVCMLEIGALISVPIIAIEGYDAAPFARALGYAIAAVGICLFLWHWQDRQGIGLGDIIRFEADAPALPVVACVAACLAGVGLALCAYGYQQLLLHAPWPEVREPMERNLRFFAESPNARTAYAAIAIGVAPWAEEYLFRGLMFRAMLPQWGFARALLASSAFFAILHPLAAWPPVFALGALSAALFVRTRSLLPCVVLHLAYNTIVIVLTAA